MVTTMPREIDLTRGMKTIVDDDDYQRLSAFKWLAHCDGDGHIYAERGKNVGNDRIITIKMHRFILGTSSGQIVDHINGDTLDNRKSNLRIATATQNKANSVKRKDSRQPFKGVRWEPHANKWAARISHGTTRKRLGLFDTPEDAARAYNAAASKFHGHFARLNQINED